jgi:hypothetical protein
MVMVVVGCSGEVGTVEADVPVRSALEQAAQAHEVPVSVLAGVGFFGMQLTMPADATLHGDGDETALLHGALAERAAALAKLDQREVETTLKGQLMGLAALLRALRTERLAESGAKADDGVAMSWFQDVRALRHAVDDIGDENETAFAHGVFSVVENGLDVTLGAERLVVAPIDLGPDAPRVSIQQGLMVAGAPIPITYMQSRHWSERYGTRIDRIVIHTTQGEGPWTPNYLVSNTRNVSAHFLVMRDGATYQFVQEAKKAWHAGCWNPRSIGIEHEGWAEQRNPYTGAARPYTDAQYASSAKLVAWIADKWGIPKDRAHIVGHGDRELSNCNDHWDPGPAWDWNRYLALVNQGDPSRYNPVGWMDSVTCDAVGGWTCDPDAYHRPIDVHLYSGTQFIASATANVTREPGVAAACGGHGAHGFTIALPDSLRDGVTRRLTAFAINVGRGSGNPPLANANVAITCQPRPAHATGLPLWGSVSPLASGLRYTPITPVRTLDTRTSYGVIGAGQSISVPVAGVPSDAAAVALNMAVINAGGAGYAVFGPNNGISSINYPAGEVVSGATVAPIPGGRLAVTTTDAAHLIADVTGYFSGTGAGLVAAPYRRVFDSRSSGAAGAGQELWIDARGVLPAGATAAMVNLAIVAPAQAGFLAAGPCGVALGTSSVNFKAGQTVATHATVPVRDGSFCIRSTSVAHVIVDVGSAFVNGQGASFTAVAPVRLMDTRAPNSAITGRLAPGQEVRIPLETLPGAPSSGAVSVTLTVAGPQVPGWLSAGPCGTLGQHSNLNFGLEGARANQAILPVAGGLCLLSSATADVIVDLTGVFQ